jgi:TonB-dependent SusC/RagA subfamily outer membrane receptor
VDGFPLVGGLSMINPNEVDNLTVLKGSSATSLYGSRAANGVILITTKRAKEGQTSIQFNHTFGIAQVPKKGRPNLMNAKEFLADRKAFWEDKIRYEDYTDGIPELYQNPEKWTGPDTDWFDEVLQTATLKTYNLSLLSSKGKFSSATILGYYDEEGAMINSSYKRYSLRSNNDYQVNDKLRIGISVAPTFQVNNNLNNTTGMFNVVYAATVTPPIFSPNDKNPDGSVKPESKGEEGEQPPSPRRAPPWG